MRSSDRKRNLYGTNPECNLIRQKIADFYDAKPVALDDKEDVKKMPNSSIESTSINIAKCRIRIIEIAKLLKISPRQIEKKFKQENVKFATAQSLIDNRILSSLIVQNKISSKHIQKTFVTFKNITFYDGFIKISSGELKPLLIKDDLSYAILNVLDKYWTNTNELFEIYYVSNQILAISPLVDINKYIQELYTIASKNIEIEDYNSTLEGVLPLLSIQEIIPQNIIQRGIAFKSPYIDFLSLHQKNDVIYRCLEQNNNTKEEVFIFSIPIDDERIALIFENVNFGRSTEVFISYKDNCKSSIEKIFNWFTSYHTNKREELRAKQVENSTFNTIEYYSIPHLDINQWMLRINKIIKINFFKEDHFYFVPGFRSPADITKEIQPSSGYKVRNLHNLLARKLYNALNDQYPNQVGSEIQIVGQYRIDMVVKNADESFMFFEIKTYDDALKCIREGVGQLMSYKFLVRDCCRVTKLVIVGIAEKTKEIEEYMAIYNSEDLPISYIQMAV